MERDHVVPLSSRAINILTMAQTLCPTGDLCFPDRHTGKPMSENRFLIIRNALGYADRCTPHGFRSSFRDWVAKKPISLPRLPRWLSPTPSKTGSKPLTAVGSCSKNAAH